MKYDYLFDYPNNLQNIFDKLNRYSINAIIVGGYVRDKFLNLDSKDIDIELYGVTSFEKLENILQEFGDVNLVGKSFGVCKLKVKDLDLDFTLPRTDNKTSTGHRGFEVIIDKSLDFKAATSRRDFTINSIGYDTKNKIILDPFNGLEDINNKTLKAVNLQTFSEDPLRVLRAVSFASRFDFTLDDALFDLCKSLYKKNVLDELAQERIYDEIKKILLKSPKPSVAFLLLKDLHALKAFTPLDTLDKDTFTHINDSLDTFIKIKTQDSKTNIIIMLSILSHKFNINESKKFITRLSDDKNLLKNAITLLENNIEETYTDTQLYNLATKVNIEHFILYSQALHKDINPKCFNSIKKRAIELNILNKKAQNHLKGKDLLEMGLEPSKEYSLILDLAYEAQINLKINSHQEALVWLKKYLKNQ